MEGGRRSGFYSSKVVDTLPCINELVPIALESVRSYPVCPGFVFTTADYGCAVFVVRRNSVLVTHKS